MLASTGRWFRVAANIVDADVWQQADAIARKDADDVVATNQRLR